MAWGGVGNPVAISTCLPQQQWWKLLKKVRVWTVKSRGSGLPPNKIDFCWHCALPSALETVACPSCKGGGDAIVRGNNTQTSSGLLHATKFPNSELGRRR